MGNWTTTDLQRWRAEMHSRSEQDQQDAAVVAYGLRYELAVQALEIKAAQIRAEVGDEELARRFKVTQASWRAEQRIYAEYRHAWREAKAAHRKLPPNPHYDPDGWRRWQQEQPWLRSEGRH